MSNTKLANWHNVVLILAGYLALTIMIFAPQIVSAESSKENVTNIEKQAKVEKGHLSNSQQPSSANSFQLTAKKLTSAKLKNIPVIIDELIAMVGSPAEESQAKTIINRLLAGELYFQRENNNLVIAKVTQSKHFDLYNTNDNTLLASEVTKKSIKKVRTSNKVRKALRTSLAKLQIKSSDVKQRIDSITNLMSNLDETALTILKSARLQEKNVNVKKKLDKAIAIGNLSSSDELIVTQALTQLDGSLEPQVRNAVSKLINNPMSPAVEAQAKTILKSIEDNVAFYGYVERIFFGLSLGSILLLVAAGLAITFGVMGVINMAHGELIMIGAYTTYVVQLLMPNHIELSLLIAIPAAFIVSGLFGIGIERGVIRFLKGRPLETLLATFGISLILQQLVRTVFSPLNRQVIAPDFMSGAWQINPVFSLTYNRIYILIFALVVFFLLQLLMKKTKLGLNVRAVSQNRNMARAMGIKSEWVDAMTFGLGSGIAGLAGVALTQITNVGPNLGQSYIIDSFMVVVFGGVGNLWGTFVGAFIVGGLNKFLEPVTGTVLATIIVLILIILFIQRRPRGLFPQKGRAAES